MSIGLSTHILNTMSGLPAVKVQVDFRPLSNQTNWLSTHHTDADGRINQIGPEGYHINAGHYALQFHIGDYFNAQHPAIDSFYQLLPIHFNITPDRDHYHIPLLLSPFGYTTYRGS